jgi:hypothetical protein
MESVFTGNSLIILPHKTLFILLKTSGNATIEACLQIGIVEIVGNGFLSPNCEDRPVISDHGMRKIRLGAIRTKTDPIAL